MSRTNRSRKAGLAELGLIERLRARTAQGHGREVRLGIGDDCALLGLRPSEEIAITTDLSIAGRHFRLDWHSPESVGHRTLARGLSDLAAMGARPAAAFLSLGLPRELVQRKAGRLSEVWIERFFEGLLALAKAYKTPLAGGDLAEAPIAAADIVLVGAVPRGRALLRSGARPGDLLYATGRLGGSAAALKKLAEMTASRRRRAARRPHQAADKESELAPHLYPEPRVAQGLWLMRRRLATAALDLSDGLSTDLARLCRESGVGAEVEAVALPVYPGATLDEALNGGEDYELLFTARPDARIPRSIAAVPVTRIGWIVRTPVRGPRVALVGAEWKRPLEARGWEHFS